MAWEMKNGYALCTRAGLDSIADHLGSLQPEQLDILRGQLRIGIHRDVEVTDSEGDHRPLVSQAFGSALPVAYTRVPPSHWEPFASPVLEAAYEATMSAALLNAKRGASNVGRSAYPTWRLGGGAIGNHDDWIHAAMRRSLEGMREFDLDVKLVSYGRRRARPHKLRGILADNMLPLSCALMWTSGHVQKVPELGT
jgi:hypothetical protein